MATTHTSGTPLLSHGNSSRTSTASSTASTASTRTVALGLRQRDRDRLHDLDFDDDLSQHSTQHGEGADTGASPPSPSQASRLTLSLRALTLSSPPSSGQDQGVFGSPLSSTDALPPQLTSPDLLSDQLLSLYEQTLHKLLLLRSTERTLSSQSGQLLKALQSEESLVNTLNTTLKRVRHEHKKLLGRISSPRWEVRHHYHMTSMEHSLGHHQPHVMDVAEMLPGHLRLYALARYHALIKRSFTSSTARAKSERNAAAEQIKEGYRQLKETRSEIKELTKLLQFMQNKTYLLDKSEDKLKLEAMMRKHRKQLASLSTTASAQQAAKGLGLPRSIVRDSIASPTNASAIRMRYLKSLNLAPKPYEARSEASEAAIREEKRRVMESYNSEWRNMLHLFTQLEQQKSSSNNPNPAAPLHSSSLTTTVTNAASPPAPAVPLSAVDAVSVEDEELDHEALSDASTSDVVGELRLVHNYRKRMGLSTLPSPLTFSEDEASLDVRVKDEHDPNELEAGTDADGSDQRDETIRGLIDKAREIAEPASPNLADIPIGDMGEESPKSAPAAQSVASTPPSPLSLVPNGRGSSGSSSQPNSPTDSQRRARPSTGLFGFRGLRGL